MKKLIAIILTASVLAITASAATPLYKPPKFSIPTITVPHYDFSAAVDAYLDAHPLDIG